MGKKVGNGQCNEVARYALKSAGDQSRQQNADFPAKGDYVWGKFIACLETTGRGRLKESGNRKDIQAGDIIQFRDVTMKGKKPIGRGYYTRSIKHHTAVVSEVQYRGRVVKVYHQNTNGQKLVVEHSLNLDDLSVFIARLSNRCHPRDWCGYPGTNRGVNDLRSGTFGLQDQLWPCLKTTS
jgi:hypothetical protein